jgi:hypothetical protein
MDYDYDKIREYYHSLAEIQNVFNQYALKSSSMAEGNLVNEYQNFLSQAEQDLPGLLKPFNDNDYFSHSNDSRSRYYHAEGIQAHIGRNLGILRVRKDRASENPVTVSRSFDFVSDPQIKRILERDYGEIQRNIISGNWKSAIILSGGSIEALILDHLHNDEQMAKASPEAPSEPNLDKWHLNDLIEVAVETHMVGDEVAKLSHSVREYRNLIHPGVEVRTNLKVEPEEAKIAVEVLNILIRELSE